MTELEPTQVSLVPTRSISSASPRDFPPPPDFFRGVFRVSRDELRALQERRFLRR